MDPEQMLIRATAELEAAEAELRTAQQRVEELRMIQQGIQLAIQRYGHAVTVPAPTPTPTPTPGDTTLAPSSGGDDGRGDDGGLYDPSPSVPVPATTIHANHSDLCEETLREFGRPVTSTEIRERLRQRGHEYNAEQTRGTMAYLLRKNRVVRTAPGVWILREQGAAASNGTSPQFGGRKY